MELIIGLTFLYAIYYFFRNKDKTSVKKVSDLASESHHTESEDDSVNNNHSDEDTWEGAFWDVQSPRKVSANLKIKYRDAAGSSTDRTIKLMKYGPWEGGSILWAYCNLRNANRTFRTDRISACTDIDTGEVIVSLENWLDSKYQQSPERAIEKIVESSWDVIRVLFYIGKADGRLTQKERAIVRNAVRSMSDHPAIDDKSIDDMLDAVGGLSINAFKQSFGRLVNQNRDKATQVASWASDLVATEKTISASEKEALEYMKERLNSKI